MRATIKNVIGDLCDIEEIKFSGSAQELRSLLAEFGFTPSENKALNTDPCCKKESTDGYEASAFEDEAKAPREQQEPLPRNYMELDGAEVLDIKAKFAYLKVFSREDNDAFVIDVGWMDSLKSVNPNEVMSMLWRSLQSETGDTSMIEAAHVEKNTLLAHSSYEGRHFFALRDDIVDWLREQLKRLGAKVDVKDL